MVDNNSNGFYVVRVQFIFNLYQWYWMWWEWWFVSW